MRVRVRTATRGLARHPSALGAGDGETWEDNVEGLVQCGEPGYVVVVQAKMDEDILQAEQDSDKLLGAIPAEAGMSTGAILARQPLERLKESRGSP